MWHEGDAVLVQWKGFGHAAYPEQHEDRCTVPHNVKERRMAAICSVVWPRVCGGQRYGL